MDVGFSIHIHGKLSTQIPGVCAVSFVVATEESRMCPISSPEECFAITSVITLTCAGMLLARLLLQQANRN